MRAGRAAPSSESEHPHDLGQSLATRPGKTRVRQPYRGVTLSVEDRHWWYRGRRRVVGRVLAGLGLPPGARILDAGCGGGGNFATLARFGRVTGLEPDAGARAAAQERGLGEVAEGGLAALPFEDGSFNVATALDVIEHLDDDRGALGELRRVLVEGGFLVVTVPAYQWLWSPHDVANEHRRRYARRQLLAVAEAAGWHPVQVSYFNSLLLPIVAAHRLRQRRRLGEQAPPVSDFERTPAWVDGLLELPFRVEAALISAGVRVPAGLSLLGVFRARG